MPAAARALLLALCALLAAPAHLQQASDPCNITGAHSTNTFSLTVAPADYKEHTLYTVTLNGPANVTAVQFQALDSSTNTSFGVWTIEPETHLCSDKHLLYNTSRTNYAAHWTSPNTTAASVEIRAYISEAGALHLVTYNLRHVSSNTSTTTEGPRETGTSKPPATDVTHSPHTAGKPTNTTSMPAITTKGGSNSGTYSSCVLIAILQSVYLMFISGRQ